MHFACWISKATHINWESVILSYGTKSYVNVPQCYIFTYTDILVHHNQLFYSLPPLAFQTKKLHGFYKGSVPNEMNSTLWCNTFIHNTQLPQLLWNHFNQFITLHIKFICTVSPHIQKFCHAFLYNLVREMAQKAIYKIACVHCAHMYTTSIDTNLSTAILHAVFRGLNLKQSYQKKGNVACAPTWMNHIFSFLET
jgi:hypothetical protein